MLAQFQTRYPTGSLISELLTIYQGKFIVRVSAQVEGVNRATGMAAAETLELAEDRARERALAVLVSDQVSTPPKATATEIAGDVIPTEEVGESKRLSQSREHRDDFIAQTHNQAATNALNDLDLFVSAATPDPVNSSDVANDRDHQDSSLNELASTPLDLEPDLAFDFETTSEIPTSSGSPPISFSNVTPLVPRSYNSVDATPTETLAQTKTVATSEPIDLSDAIARTNVELKRLEWSNQDGRKYLEKTYGKRSRQHLTDQELLDFLHYLESLPSP